MYTAFALALAAASASAVMIDTAAQVLYETIKIDLIIDEPPRT